ncbi:MAG: hypothetical protein KatS3mg096_048 [Candidatus Parcubacteria bacterium]|nr:MAG: hypothetical protein KatS3mg096_048 [Candidatus Parcubacteria bacterium]
MKEKTKFQEFIESVRDSQAEGFLGRLKTDRLLQIIVAGNLILLLILFFIFRPIIFPKKVKTPCYQETIKIWVPFIEDQIYPYFSDFSRYCVNFEITTKNLEEIKRDLILALAKGDFPDIVLIDNDFLNKEPDLFSSSTPIIVDSLIAFYNQDILNFLNLQKPKTFDELKNFIQQFKNYSQDFYPLGLGTKEIRHRKEIILSLMSLNESYKQKEEFQKNILSALDIFTSFNNPQSEFYTYPENAGDDLINFANEKSAMYIGFYSDKKEILQINPRINLSLDIYPLNTFPPKVKIYSKIFYLAQVKKSRSKAVPYFINWFYAMQLKRFSQDLDLVPFKEADLTPEKKIVFDSVKNFGETFDFLNKEVLFNNIDRILEVYHKDENELNRILVEINYSL